MKTRPPKNQSGFALIMFLLLIMTAGGFLLVEFTEGMQNAFDSKKFGHNRRVLEEAKRALLQSAYNYPVTNDLGPGRLPCADTDNDGLANCGSTFGRLPWNQPNLNLYDIRDADNERLWYAVSSSFRPQAAVINSGTPGTTYLSSGTITLRDQEGHVIFDGSNPDGLTQYGIAALIIAPGVSLYRNGVKQDRSVVNTDDPFDTVADTDPGIITAANYLDLVVGAEDNAGFINSSATDGFILGANNDTTNDQFIVITAAEVIEMAEMATLQAYQTAINDFRVNTKYCEGETPDGATTEALCLAASGTWTLGHYPWLYNYAGVSDIAALSSYFPAKSDWAAELATNLDNYGRIPATFAEYFSETDSQSIDSALSGSIGITIPQEISCSGCISEFTSDGGEFEFHDYSTVKTPGFKENQILTDVKFVDIAEVVGEVGRLTGNSATAVSGTLEMFFWDDDEIPTEIYTPCGDDGNGIPEVSDCNRDSSGNPKPGGANLTKSIILYMAVSLDFPYSAGAISIDMDYSIDPVVTAVPASANSHAVISATFAKTSIINPTMPTISGGSFKIDAHYHVGDTYLFQDFPMADSGSIDSSTFVVEGPLTLGIRYYPELPEWVFTNEWHNSVRMAYANDYRPDTLTGPCSPNVDCLKMNDIAGDQHNKVSLLVIAGEHDWDDEDTNGMSDEILDVFDDGNHNDNQTFYLREGNDKILIVEEL